MDLNLYPYQVQITHKLIDFDMERRMEVGKWFNEMMEGDQEWIRICGSVMRHIFTLMALSVSTTIVSGR